MSVDRSPLRLLSRTIELLATDHPEKVLTPWSGIFTFFSEWRMWTAGDILILLIIALLDLYIFGIIAWYGIRPALKHVRPLFKVGIVGFFLLCWATFTFLGLIGQVMVPLMLRSHHGV